MVGRNLRATAAMYSHLCWGGMVSRARYAHSIYILVEMVLMSMSITAHRRVLFLFRVTTERTEGVAAGEVCDGGNNSCPFLG